MSTRNVLLVNILEDGGWDTAADLIGDVVAGLRRVGDNIAYLREGID